ncbi:LysR family transcriptional regulator [Celeribacter indicus]|uniref:LysR family transcriptional regulator n=1 Tax=Celeribacter indicus TaxID=1208324 RepID=A0A0B5DZ88_9RHOB|nr:LysR family transcriptional regulator [Celeribacter indicus]AJE48733.1 LysR family transcriptional regulator [Celeribacter indicus]
MMREEKSHMRQQFTSLPALACFRVAAELESFSKAADRLNLTLGAVSRAVRLLEDDLGTPLFERRNRAVFLTDAGRRLAQVVARGLGEIEEEARRIKAAQAHAPVTVSCEPTLMMRWLIPRMPRGHRRGRHGAKSVAKPVRLTPDAISSISISACKLPWRGWASQSGRGISFRTIFAPGCLSRPKVSIRMEAPITYFRRKSRKGIRQ